jgi:hypothetical protein
MCTVLLPPGVNLIAVKYISYHISYHIISLPQIFYTNITYLVWSPWLILISQLYTKIGVVHFSNEACNVSLMIFNHKLTTYITKTVWRVHTTTTWYVHSTTQYKIKLRLKNERALTARLEHEEVLNHSLLDFFLLPC